MKDNKLITISSPSINLVGDKVLAEQFIGPAKSQMRILENSMKFQNLSQAIRRVKLNTDVYVECVRVFNLSIINIVANSVSSKALKVIEDTLSDLYIVFGPYEVKLSLSSVEIAFTPGSSISCSGGCAGEITYVDLLSGGSQVIYGHFTGYSDGALITSGAASGVNSYNQFRYYRHDYRYFKLANNNISNEVFSDGFKIESAFDFYTPFEDAISEDQDVKEWSKTLKTFMVVARLQEPKDMTGIASYPFSKYSNIQYYFQAAYNGKEVKWGTSRYIGPYYRYKIVDDYGIEDHLLYTLHIGFDLWEDDEGDFFAGIMLDSTAKLSIYKLNKLTYKMELQTEYTSTVRNDYYTYLDETYLPSYVGDIRYTSVEKRDFIRLLGYGYKKETDEHVAYWGDLHHEAFKFASAYNNDGSTSRYDDIEASNFYCSEVLNTGSSEKHYLETKYPPVIFPDRLQPKLISSIWNPLTRTIKFVYHDSTENISSEYSTKPTTWYPDYYFGVYEVDTDKGDFVVDDIKLSEGSTYTYTESYDAWPIAMTAISYEAKRYKIERMIFTPQGDLIFEYSTNDLVTTNPCCPYFIEDFPSWDGMTKLTYECLNYNDYCHSYDGSSCGDSLTTWYHGILGDDYTYYDELCECIEYVWNTKFYGNNEYLKYAADFHRSDEGWTAVLLSGEDKDGNNHENWIIYKDLETPGNYLAVSSSGIKKTLTGIDRAFFFQYYNEEII